MTTKQKEWTVEDQAKLVLSWTPMKSRHAMRNYKKNSTPEGYNRLVAKIREIMK